MEKMPYRSELDDQSTVQASAGVRVSAGQAIASDWRASLPVMTGKHVTLRELRASDAPSLFAMLTTEEVARFISPPPTTVDGFERFIAWTLRMRSLGTYACFAVTVAGGDTAIGIFQLRELDADFGTAEWGFAIGSPYWGTGVFQEGAEFMVDFAFETVGVHRLEARAAVANGRGNGALRKIGAVQEGVLRRSFLRHGEYLDQVLWSILEEDWYESERALSMHAVIH
jgi:ribosomal-protein-alanine N-acetyltransferase